MKKSTPTFSIVSPVYKAEKLVLPLVQRIRNAMELMGMDFEIILVEDCGGDNSWNVILSECKKDERVKGLKLSRNFGQQHAIQAGLDFSSGKYIVVLDCDLQDRPEEITKLYDKILEGNDIAVASRMNRQDGFLKKVLSKAFNALMSYLTGTKQDDTIANFFIITDQVLKALSKIKDKNRYYPLLLQWVGYRYVKVEIPHAAREDELGSSYSIRRRLRLALDTIITFSEKPLRLTLKFGLLLAFFSFLAALGLVFLYFLSETEVAGWSSLILLLSFFSGLIISILGMIGLYLGKTFDAVKDRPTYIIHQIENE